MIVCQAGYIFNWSIFWLSCQRTQEKPDLGEGDGGTHEDVSAGEDQVGKSWGVKLPATNCYIFSIILWDMGYDKFGYTPPPFFRLKSERV